MSDIDVVVFIFVKMLALVSQRRIREDGCLNCEITEEMVRPA